MVADESTLYYYNGNWQVLAETDANGTTQRWFVYGNYIDEALMMVAACLEQGGFAHRLYYIQDGLYSTRALVADKGWVIEEQTYYDVYGRARTWTSGDADADGDVDGDDVNEFIANFFESECDAGYNWRCDVDNSGVVDTTEWPAFNRNGSTPANQQSYFTNPYYFTGRRVDFLDNGSLKLQYNRHRYYDYYAGRWLTQDPLGYVDGLNLYEYAKSKPVLLSDPIGGCSGGDPLKKASNRDLSGFKCNPSFSTDYFLVYAWSDLAHGITPEDALTRSRIYKGAVLATVTPFDLPSTCNMYSPASTPLPYAVGIASFSQRVSKGTILARTVDWYAYIDEYKCVKNDDDDCKDKCGNCAKHVLEKTNDKGIRWKCDAYDEYLTMLWRYEHLGIGAPDVSAVPAGALAVDPDAGEFKNCNPSGRGPVRPPDECLDKLKLDRATEEPLLLNLWY